MRYAWENKRTPISLFVILSRILEILWRSTKSQTKQVSKIITLPTNRFDLQVPYSISNSDIASRFTIFSGLQGDDLWCDKFLIALFAEEDRHVYWPTRNYSGFWSVQLWFWAVSKFKKVDAWITFSISQNLQKSAQFDKSKIT